MKISAEIADNAEKSSERGGQGTKGQRGAQKERVEMPPVLQAPHPRVARSVPRI